MMLRGNKSPGTLVAEIKMLRMSHGGAFLIVEGKDDVRFWNSRRHVSCELVDGEGKLNVIGAISRVDAVGFVGTLGIVDDDCDFLTGARLESGNLCYTDAHDLECLLCRSTALDKVLAEHGDPEKIRRFQEETGDVRDALLDRALVFGHVRLAARLARPTIDLGFKVQQFVNPGTWTVEADAEELIRTAVPDSPQDVVAIADQLARLPKADPWFVARGHDMVEILRIGLQGVLGNIRAHIGANDIARILRAGLSPEDLRKTQLWADVRAWQAANSPYIVLAD